MPVDKVRRNSDRTTPVYTGIGIANLTNSLLEEMEVTPQLELLI